MNKLPNLGESQNRLRMSHEVYNEESLYGNTDEVARSLAEDLDGRFYSWGDVGVVLSGFTRFDLFPTRHAIVEESQLIAKTPKSERYVEEYSTE